MHFEKERKKERIWEKKERKKKERKKEHELKERKKERKNKLGGKRHIENAGGFFDRNLFSVTSVKSYKETKNERIKGSEIEKKNREE